MVCASPLDHPAIRHLRLILSIQPLTANRRETVLTGWRGPTKPLTTLKSAIILSSRRVIEETRTRYEDAVEQKPDDSAIHVRLGRALERLGELSLAREQYLAAVKLQGPEKWQREAREALSRLRQASQ